MNHVEKYQSHSFDRAGICSVCGAWTDEGDDLACVEFTTPQLVRCEVRVDNSKGYVRTAFSLQNGWTVYAKLNELVQGVWDAWAISPAGIKSLETRIAIDGYAVIRFVNRVAAL